MTTFSKKFRLKNPFKPDEQIQQEVIVSDSPQYNYEDSPWVAIDTEFLNLNLERDQLCVIQIASPDPERHEHQRIEVIWVWEKLNINQAEDITSLITSLFERKELELLMHVSSADFPRIAQLTAEKFQGKLFDTKVGGKIALTNTNNHGMEDLIKALIDPNFSKDNTQTGSQWDLSPEMWGDKAIEYAMNDVIYLRPLQLQLQRIADRRGTADVLSEAQSIMPTIANLYRAGYSEKILSY